MHSPWRAPAEVVPGWRCCPWGAACNRAAGLGTCHPWGPMWSSVLLKDRPSNMEPCLENCSLWKAHTVTQCYLVSNVCYGRLMIMIIIGKNCARALFISQSRINSREYHWVFLDCGKNSKFMKLIIHQRI